MIPTKIKKQIVEHLRLVPIGSIWGFAISTFIDQADQKTDEQYLTTMRDLKGQIRDNAGLMNIILGDAFDFVNDFKIERYEKRTRTFVFLHLMCAACIRIVRLITGFFSVHKNNVIGAGEN